MNSEMKYGDVALGVEAALPTFRPEERSDRGYPSLRRTLVWLYSALKRWA